jgi:hypothetical protein
MGVRIMKTLINNPFGKTLLLIFIIATLITVSCAKTRTIDPLTQSEQSKIKKIAILVEADEEFSVSVSKEKPYWSERIGRVDAGMGGIILIPLAIVASLTEYGIRSHIDEKHEESLEAKLTHFQPEELMREKLKNYLELSNAGFIAEIPEVTSPSMLKAEGFDTILEVNLNELGLILCEKNYLSSEEHEALNEWGKYHNKTGSARPLLYSAEAFPVKQEELQEMERLKPIVRRIYTGKVNVWIELYGRMISIDDNSTAWERKELYKDENCYPLEDLKTQPELLVDILTKAINNLAINTVNEVL